MHLNHKMKDPNLSDEIKEMKRAETLTETIQKLRDDQQIVIKMIRKN